MIQYPLKVGAAWTRVLEAGQGGTPLILVHGVGARADRWRQNVDPLAAAGFHVYAFDLPGHGLAKKGADFEYSVAGWKDFLGAFMKEAGIERAALIGTSLGGHIVSAFACEQPQRVQALVLVGSLGLQPMGPEWRETMRRGLVNTTVDAVRTKLLRVNYDPAMVTDALVDEEFKINNSFGAAEAFARIAAYFGDRIDADVVGERLAGVTATIPTLLVWGAQERSVPVAVGEAARRLLPKSRLVLISGTAHGPYNEKPNEFNHVVTDFLQARLGAFTSPDVEFR
jgi:2-hydroxy-6-oxonona-2,4-dienedioate hydrolase